MVRIPAAHCDKLAIAVERQLGLDRQVARLIIAEEGLAALAGPLDRTADLARRPGHQCEFRIERAARPEIAADLVHDDPHLVLWDAEDLGELLLRPDGAANPGIKRVAPDIRVKGTGGGGIADLGIDRDVGAGVSPRERCVRLHRRHRVGHRRQWFVIHGDQFGGVLSGGKGRCHDHCYNFPAMARFFRRHREMRRDERR